MIKMLTACGAGVNSSHQIKDAVEEEMKNRGYDVSVDAEMIKDVTPENGRRSNFLTNQPS